MAIWRAARASPRRCAEPTAVIHLAGVTKALRLEDYYTGNVRATEQLATPWQGRESAWST